jgi:hypothetical protein
MTDTKAHQRYKTSKGLIVPGVTTVLGLLNKPFLVPWAWRLGMEGQDYRKVTDKAASIGTVAHYLVECHLKGVEPDGDELANFSKANLEQGNIAAGQFKDWWGERGLKTFKCKDMNGETTVTSEIQLVSEEGLFGGTIDAMAKDANGKVTLLDVKTSKGIYDEHRYQLAAYWHMWNENNPKAPVQQAYIIHLDKETGNIGFHALGNLDTEWEIFSHLRAIYHLQKGTDKHRNMDKKYHFKGAPVG